MLKVGSHALPQSAYESYAELLTVFGVSIATDTLTAVQKYSYSLPRHLQLIFLRGFFINHVRWVPVSTAWRVLGLRMKGRPPAVEGSCEYID
jgi:hypothetical protein